MRRHLMDMMAYYGQLGGIELLKSFGYITDGLVAVFDGEYNAGDHHDPNSSKWRDVVSGLELDYIGTDAYEWLGKSCRFMGESGYGCFIRDDGVQKLVGTLENVSWYETVGGTSIFPRSNCFVKYEILGINSAYKDNNGYIRSSGIKTSFTNGETEINGWQANQYPNRTAFSIQTITMTCPDPLQSKTDSLLMYYDGVKSGISWQGPSTNQDASSIRIGGLGDESYTDIYKGRGGYSASGRTRGLFPRRNSKGTRRSTRQGSGRSSARREEIE